MKIGETSVFVASIIAIAIVRPVAAVRGDAYSFSGLTVSNFAVFETDSVANALDLNQGPNRDGTGAKANLNVFGTSQSDFLEESFNNLTSLRGGEQQLCIGNCSSAEDNFSRPPSLPADPTSNAQFGRSDSLMAATGAPFLGTTLMYESSTVAEMELDQVPPRLWYSHAVNQLIWFVDVHTAGELVIDFDADILLRSLNQSAIPNATIRANSTFQVSIISPSNTEVFRFSPHGSGIGDIGATVVADPFDLNDSVVVRPTDSIEDKQMAGVGQFRAISPTLLPGNGYRISIGQEVRVAAVPEPESVLLLLAGIAGVCSFKRVSPHLAPSCS